MQANRPVFRFAPSPNGELHLGHAFSALFGQAMAQRFGGRFLLRIEDTDAERCRPEYEARIYDDLAWLGIDWEKPVRRQSAHAGDYAASLGKLKALGVVYPCFASRKEIAAAAGPEAPRDPDGSPLYPGIFRNADPAIAAARMAEGEQYAWRLDMAKAVNLAMGAGGGTLSFLAFDSGDRRTVVESRPERWGDVALSRSDRAASYHLAVVTDDALQGVTHVTRGMDMYAATDIHRVLQALLGLPAPLYCHHRLILDAAGRKLSKSARDKSLRALRGEGVTPLAIRAMLGITPEGIFVDK